MRRYLRGSLLRSSEAETADVGREGSEAASRGRIIASGCIANEHALRDVAVRQPLDGLHRARQRRKLLSLPVASDNLEDQSPPVRSGRKEVADADVRDRNLGLYGIADTHRRDRQSHGNSRPLRARPRDLAVGFPHPTTAWSVAVEAAPSTLPLAVRAGEPFPDLVAVLAVVAWQAADHRLGHWRRLRHRRARAEEQQTEEYRSSPWGSGHARVPLRGASSHDGNDESPPQRCPEKI